MTPRNLLFNLLLLVFFSGLLRRRELAALLRQVLRRWRPAPVPTGAAPLWVAQVERILRFTDLFIAQIPRGPLVLRRCCGEVLCSAPSLPALCQRIWGLVQEGEFPDLPVQEVWEPGQTAAADLEALGQALVDAGGVSVLRFNAHNGGGLFELQTRRWALTGSSFAALAQGLPMTRAADHMTLRACSAGELPC